MRDTRLKSPALLCLWLALAGCTLPAPESGTLLDAGSTPVAQADFRVRARHTDLVSVRVVFPSDSLGRPVRPPEGSRLPALVFIQGGLVPPGDYLWLAHDLAARGFVVALPSHPLDLALSAIDNGRFARELLTSPPEDSLLEGLVDPERIAVAGHSLGGVVASKLALDGGFAALALLASYPDSADADRVPSLAVPSLSLAGELDCSASLPRVRAEAARLPSPSVFVVLQGVTHYQFTVSDQQDVARDCLPATPLPVAHERISEVLVRFLLAALSGQGTGADDIRQVPGTEVTAR
jgi:pimeloyl-ACP methyl ester carboxylesterase